MPNTIILYTILQLDFSVLQKKVKGQFTKARLL